MVEYTSPDLEYRVVWTCSSQSYTVYKNGRYLRRAFKFSDIKSYLA